MSLKKSISFSVNVDNFMTSPLTLFNVGFVVFLSFLISVLVGLEQLFLITNLIYILIVFIVILVCLIAEVFGKYFCLAFLLNLYSEEHSA